MKKGFKERMEILLGIRTFIKRNSTKHLINLEIIKVILLFLGISRPILFKFTIDEVMIERKLSFLTWIVIAYVGLYIIESVVLIRQKLIENRVYNKLTFDVRLKLWKNYTKMPQVEYEKYQAGDLKNRIDTDTNLIEGFLSQQVIEYSFNWLMVICTGVIIVIINWKLALFGLLMVPFSFWMTNWLGGGVKRTTEEYRQTWGIYDSWLQEIVQGWKEVKALTLERRARKVFTKYWHGLSIKFFIRQMYWYGNRTFIALKDFFITKMNLYFLGGLLIFNGEMTIGSLLVFMKYFEQFFGAIGNINNMDMTLKTEIPLIQRVLEIISKDVVPKKQVLKNITEIDFSNLTFSYPGREEVVLKGVTFKIGAGDRLAIVGRSGCGKTTLVKIMLGLCTNYTGSVKINGVEIKDIDLVSLHKKVGVVMQDSVLFNMSIKENLLLANPQASITEIKLACQKACINDFIEGLPMGYDTLIGEKGIKLSGGQRQRLAIARLFLTDVEVVIFDEATSSLDHDSEKRIHDIIKNLVQEKTVIIIAHRLSSVLLADQTIVLNEGTIIAKGKNMELLNQNAIYQTLFKKQYEGMMIS